MTEQEKPMSEVLKQFKSVATLPNSNFLLLLALMHLKASGPKGRRRALELTATFAGSKWTEPDEEEHFLEACIESGMLTEEDKVVFMEILNSYKE